MADVIQLLPDSVANQIAAGEVIQRPASVVKELVENAIDAGATSITVNIKDSGRTLIQVIDNGCGMSETDARMAFERHATSKIRSARDIFSIHTMGFRGEALASIASVAQVELKTKREEDELGTHIVINGAEFVTQEPTQTQNGTIFTIKNLFFNIPVRRKFLKSNNVEFRHIVDEFQRVALAYPEVTLQLFHNEKEQYNLPKSNKKQRIVNLLGKQHLKTTLNIETTTSLAKIYGFIGTPDSAKKRGADQFFFVNDRFMKHKSFYGAVMRAYENLIPNQSYPAFFIYFDIEPEEIDINIHPTKTEIKFTNEYQICQILEATVREALGKFNVVPSLDFDDEEDYNDIFKPTTGTFKTPGIEVNTAYNPFEIQKTHSNNSGNTSYKKESSRLEKDNFGNWESLFSGFENSQPEEPETFESVINNEKDDDGVFQAENKVQKKFMQLKGRYIVTPVKSGLMIINQKHAHEKICYQKLKEKIKSDKKAIQSLLYPVSIELSIPDFDLITEQKEHFQKFGFEFETMGKRTIVLNGVPSDIDANSTEEIFLELVSCFNENCNAEMEVQENIAQALAKASSITYGATLSETEMQDLTDKLFQLPTPQYLPNGKRIVAILEFEEILKKFN